MRNKLKIWTLAFFIYLATFGTPIGVGYWLFAEQIEAKTGGGFFYIVGAVTFILLLRKIMVAIKRQKAGVTKAIFKLTVSMVTLYLIYSFTGYIEANFGDLSKVMLFTMGGRLLGFALELWAVKIDKIYVEEIGVI